MNVDTLDALASKMKRCIKSPFKVHLEFSEGRPDKLQRLMMLDEKTFQELCNELQPIYETEEKPIKAHEKFDVYAKNKDKIKRALKYLMLKEIIAFKKPINGKITEDHQYDVEIREEPFLMNARINIVNLFFYKPCNNQSFITDEEEIIRILKKASDEEFGIYLNDMILVLGFWQTTLDEDNSKMNSLVLTNISRTLTNVLEVLSHGINRL